MNKFLTTVLIMMIGALGANAQMVSSSDVKTAVASILETNYRKMTNGDVKSVQGDTGHAEAEMVTDVYSEIIDEDRRFNAQKMDKEFYSTLNDDTNNPTQDTAVTDSDMALLELIKSLSPEMKEQFLKQALQR